MEYQNLVTRYSLIMNYALDLSENDPNKNNLIQQSNSLRHIAETNRLRERELFMNSLKFKL